MGIKLRPETLSDSFGPSESPMSMRGTRTSGCRRTAALWTGEVLERAGEQRRRSCWVEVLSSSSSTKSKGVKGRSLSFHLDTTSSQVSTSLVKVRRCEGAVSCRQKWRLQAEYDVRI